MSLKPKIDITIVSDVICPWCWVGKRKLEMAMEKVKTKYSFEVKWEPFLLASNLPVEGKLKTSPQNERVPAHLKAAGSGVGIDFTGATNRIPNTIAAHVLLDLAGKISSEVQNILQEKLFKANFTDGIFLDEENLAKIGEEVGIEKEVTVKTLRDYSNRTQIKEEAKKWSRSGVTGVPYFIMNERRLFSGAQDVETFLSAFQKAV
eukprot:GFUD01069905.1.p1 GENE.GFUD01069905.1~~GFUD01069905.1.p1  ORF type:complete len:205 (-),score=64.78 GFUD01069905.1:85-699(-)